MTGTRSRTATASPRGGVGRKLQAKPWPEVHESHTRRLDGGRGGVGLQNPMSSRPMGVYAAGRWGESHAPYPGRSDGLPDLTRRNSFIINRCGEAGDQPRPLDRCARRPGERTQGAQEREPECQRRLGGPRGSTMDRQKSAKAENHNVAWERAEQSKPNRSEVFDG